MIKTKKTTKVELIFAIYTSFSAYQLFKNQKETFENENMMIITKRTKMSYTKRIGFIVRPYLKLASVVEYENQLNDILNM